MKLYLSKSLTLFLLMVMGDFFNSGSTYAQTKTRFLIKADQPIAKIQPSMWGVFFEDINFAADGGIYAELIKNGSFEFPRPLMGWTVESTKLVFNDLMIMNNEHAINKRYIRINNYPDKEKLSIVNEGFRGIGLKSGSKYIFSVKYRQQTPGVKLKLQLIDTLGNIIAQGDFNPMHIGTDWKKETVSLLASKTELKTKLKILFEGQGTIDLDMVSLFPEDTWKKRPGGLRKDMVQMIADMKPGFIRFPGGCIVEGGDLANRYQWKKTIGPLEDRPLTINRWNQWHTSRQTPDYFQSFGLGFLEYFQLCEDVCAEPLPILNCGMSCQFNAAELVALDDLGPYVQDALDLVEFANGSVDSKWGKIRSDLGHPKKFNLKMMGIGNENWGPQYLERLKIFKKAIKEKYPDMKIVNSAGPGPEDERFTYMNSELRKINTDLIDEHYYKNPEWFFANSSRYDNYPRNGTKVFAGEYASKIKGTVGPLTTGNWECALSEAAFLTGIERNGEVVQMASYAPLFGRVDAWQWSPDLIWVDNLNVFPSIGYYVQKMFSNNKGTDIIPFLLNGKVISGQNSIYGSSVIDTINNTVIAKVVNNTKESINSEFTIDGIKKRINKTMVTELSSTNLTQINSYNTAPTLLPKEYELKAEKSKINMIIKPYSFTVIKIQLK